MAFADGIDRGETPHEVIVRMQRIPRAAAAGALVSNMRRGDGETCIALLFDDGGHLASDIRAKFGDDPASPRRTPDLA